MGIVQNKIPLPHKPPMLLISEILECREDYTACHFQTEPDMWFFKGHFPGNPIMPGVMQIEFIAQSACLIIRKCLDLKHEEGQVPEFYLTSVENAKFKHIVRPGELIRSEVFLKKQKRGFFWFEGSVFIGDKVCCHAQISSYLNKESVV